MPLPRAFAHPPPACGPLHHCCRVPPLRARARLSRADVGRGAIATHALVVPHGCPFHCPSRSSSQRRPAARAALATPRVRLGSLNGMRFYACCALFIAPVSRLLGMSRPLPCPRALMTLTRAWGPLLEPRGAAVGPRCCLHFGCTGSRRARACWLACRSAATFLVPTVHVRRPHHRQSPGFSRNSSSQRRQAAWVSAAVGQRQNLHTTA